MGGDATFNVLREIVRTGKYRALPHFRARGAERGFTVDEAVHLLAEGAALAWPWKTSSWLVTGATPGDDYQLHVRVKLTPRGRVLLLTGWRADQRRTLRRMEAQREGT